MRGCPGFTLVEVLVALFVVALGLAGAAAVQATALRSGRDAARLADGVQLAAALVERMRANPAAMGRADADNPYLQFDFDVAGGTPAAGPSCYGDETCDADQLAQFDLTETAQAVAARFPGGRMVACRDLPEADPASGLLPWACSGAADAPVAIKLGWRDRPDEALAPKVLLTQTAGAVVGGAP
jgi:type IV pilus assembly protein PilV